ncbi:MAG: transposase [Bifidobacterium sp.]
MQVDRAMFGPRLDRMVTEKVNQPLNAMLDAGADELMGTARYGRSDAGKACRAGRCERDPTVRAGEMAVRVPKLQGDGLRVGRDRTLPTPGGERRRLCFVKLLSADMACLVVRLSGWF